MQPALVPGDRLYVLRWPRPRVGDVVVFRDPEDRLTLLAKRIATVLPGGDVYVLGDNPNVSRDSRTFGPVARKLLVGRAVFRYLPRERRGRL